VQNARTIASSVKGDGGARTAQPARPFVHVLADSSDKLARICAALEPDFTVPLLQVAAVTWCLAFFGFAAAYGPTLARPIVKAAG